MARSIDVHAHILPQDTIRQLERQSPRVAPKFITKEDGGLIMEIDGRVVQNPMPPEMWDLEMRLRDMDDNGLDMQLLSNNVQTFFYGEEAALGAACAAIQNDGIAALVKRHPDRFAGLSTLPLQDPVRAADELRRAMTTLGLRGAHIGSNVNERNLDDPALDPVWETADELGAFFLVHPHGANIPNDRLGAYYMRNFVGLPFETTMAGASLLFGGVLERFPRITFCLCHAGGFVPYQAGRFLHAWEVRPEAKVRLKGPAEESLARLTYDSITHSPKVLEALLGLVGAESVMLGSDYPFDMGNRDCAARVRALPVAESVRDLVLWDNARARLRL